MNCNQLNSSVDVVVFSLYIYNGNKCNVCIKILATIFSFKGVLFPIYFWCSYKMFNFRFLFFSLIESSSSSHSNQRKIEIERRIHNSCLSVLAYRKMVHTLDIDYYYYSFVRDVFSGTFWHIHAHISHIQTCKLIHCRFNNAIFRKSVYL